MLLKMESPWKEIIIFIFGGGLITAIIALSKEIRERVAEKKKAKKEEDQNHLSTSVEMQRLENESDEAAWNRLSEMLKQSRAEEERLRNELSSVRDTSSLSSATITRWYKCYRELGVKIDKLETQVAREKPHPELIDYLTDLKNKYDELGDKMP